MRILGIDPGLIITGYGCVATNGDARDPLLVEAGVLRFKPRMPMIARLGQLHTDLTGLLEEIQPDLVVVEQLFSHHRHVRTSILMAHARGVILLAAHGRGLQVRELLPTAVKKAVTGNGHASKRQMQRAVMAQCGLSAPPSPPDVADAIAIALCGARRLALNA